MFSLDLSGSVIIVRYHCDKTKITIFSIGGFIQMVKRTKDTHISKRLDVCKTNYRRGEEGSRPGVSEPRADGPNLGKRIKIAERNALIKTFDVLCAQYCFWHGVQIFSLQIRNVSIL